MEVHFVLLYLNCKVNQCFELDANNVNFVYYGKTRMPHLDDRHVTSFRCDWRRRG